MKWLTYPRYMFFAVPLTVLGFVLLSVEQMALVGALLILGGVGWHVLILLTDDGPHDDEGTF